MNEFYQLPAELNIYTAAETAQSMLSWFNECRNQQLALLKVDGHGVAEVDAAGLQLLASLHNSCTSLALHWQLEQPSQTLAAACARLGMPTGTSA